MASKRDLEPRPGVDDAPPCPLLRRCIALEQVGVALSAASQSFGRVESDEVSVITNDEVSVIRIPDPSRRGPRTRRSGARRSSSQPSAGDRPEPVPTVRPVARTPSAQACPSVGSRYVLPAMTDRIASTSSDSARSLRTYPRAPAARALRANPGSASIVSSSFYAQSGCRRRSISRCSSSSVIGARK